MRQRVTTVENIVICKVQSIRVFERSPIVKIAAKALMPIFCHAVSGEIWPKAVNYLRQSGTAAAMRSDYRGATLWHRAALDCLKHIRPDQETLALGIDIRFEVYNALLALGDHAPIFEVLTEG